MRKSGIAPRIALCIELSHDRADVAFEHARAEHQQHQAEVKRILAGTTRQNSPHGDEDAADQDGAPLSGDAVGHPAAAQAEQVHHGGVEAVDRAGFGIVETETAVGDLVRQKEDEDARACRSS